MVAAEAESILTLVPHLLPIPHRRIWLAYDEEADALYVNFKKPSHADDSDFTDDDVIVMYQEG